MSTQGKRQFLAHHVDSKRMSAWFLGRRCGVDLIDSTGLLGKFSYNPRNVGDTDNSRLEFEKLPVPSLKLSRWYSTPTKKGSPAPKALVYTRSIVAELSVSKGWQLGRKSAANRHGLGQY
jgi:hypothetical protein